MKKYLSLLIMLVVFLNACKAMVKKLEDPIKKIEKKVDKVKSDVSEN